MVSSHKGTGPHMKMFTCYQLLSSQEEARPHTPFCVGQMGKLRPKGKWLLQGPWGNRIPILVVFQGSLPGGTVLPRHQGLSMRAPVAWPFTVAFGDDARWASSTPVLPG